MFSPISAYAAAEPTSILLKAKSLKCFIGEGHTALWMSGKLEIKPNGMNTAMIFDDLNIQRGTASVIGNNDRRRVIFTANSSGLSFFEITPKGFTTLASVFPTPVVDNDGSMKFPLVYSRHTLVRNEVSGVEIAAPSQYYGLCQLFN